MGDYTAARRQAEAALERLARHVIPEPMSGCHLWIGSLTGGGYGSTRISGRNVRAHRAMWTLTNGPIPDGLSVLHRCDNPPCVNIAHLYLGTHMDNMRDVVGRGRHAGQKKRICKHGHMLEGGNVRLRNGWRACVACQRKWSADLNRRQDRRDRENRRRRERYATDPRYRSHERERLSQYKGERA